MVKKDGSSSLLDRKRLSTVRLCLAHGVWILHIAWEQMYLNRVRWTSIAASRQLGASPHTQETADLARARRL
jgi:hypothetical protein